MLQQNSCKCYVIWNLANSTYSLQLTISIFSLEGSMSSSDLVAFLSGLLLGGDTKARNWFSSFVRIGQKV